MLQHCQLTVGYELKQVFEKYEISLLIVKQPHIVRANSLFDFNSDSGN
jgi:hypothetical protein